MNVGETVKGARLDQPPAGPAAVMRLEQGVSPFLGRVLDQLSLTAWLPAAFLVANIAAILTLRAMPQPDLPRALASLVDQPLSVLLTIAFAMIVTTMLTQSVEYTAIRILEGYWGTSRVAHAVAAARICSHVAKRERFRSEAIRVEDLAFEASLGILRTQHQRKRKVIRALRRLHEGDDPAALPRGLRREVSKIVWQDTAPAVLMRQVHALDGRLAAYPAAQRVMPTRLGNLLRSTEDTLLNTDDDDVPSYVLDHADLISPLTLEEHDQYRNRLDMYCVLVFASVALAILGPALLVGTVHRPILVLMAIAYSALATSSYAAAVASADGYANALRSMDRRISRLR